MWRWFVDQILYGIQHRCEHPAGMVAVDILEGCREGIAVNWCRRCGAVKVDWHPGEVAFAGVEHTWRRPDPNLFRG